MGSFPLVEIHIESFTVLVIQVITIKSLELVKLIVLMLHAAVGLSLGILPIQFFPESFLCEFHFVAGYFRWVVCSTLYLNNTESGNDYNSELSPEISLILSSFSEFAPVRNINSSDVGVRHLVLLHCTNFARAYAGTYQIIDFLIA